MTMSRKDYVMIAKAVRDTYQDLDAYRSAQCRELTADETIDLVRMNLTAALYNASDKFDVTRFREACAYVKA